jgi:Holliday junction resolvase RusA-like endonuclease
MLTFNEKPLTHNNIYSSAGHGRRFLTKEGREYKARIEAVTIKHFAHLKDCDEALRFTMIVRGPWLTNKGKISKTAGDLDGMTKICLDSLCKPIGVNDACVTEIVARKEYAVTWSFEVDLVRTWSINPLKDSRN